MATLPHNVTLAVNSAFRTGKGHSYVDVISSTRNINKFSEETDPILSEPNMTNEIWTIRRPPNEGH